MLINLNPIAHIFTKQKEAEKTVRPLTRKDWINADRMVMLILTLSVIVGAVIFS